MSSKAPASALLLTDARGQVIDRRSADSGILTRLDRIELAPGFLYGEDLIGTNAIGTAITQRGPSVEPETSISPRRWPRWRAPPSPSPTGRDR